MHSSFMQSLTPNLEAIIFNNYKLYLRCNDLISLREFILYQVTQIHQLDSSKTVVIILDSLDQLTSNDFKQVDKWLMVDLPYYLKLIVSTVPDHGDLFNLITKMIKKRYDEQLKSKNFNIDDKFHEEKLNKQLDKQLLQVTELTAEQTETILARWLTAANKKLTEEQWTDLRVMFERAKLLLLFLKLSYDVVVDWYSWTIPDKEFLNCQRIEDIIIYMFKKMERMHGKTAFKRAICYMTVNRNGISDTELEDLLSIDEDVLFSIFQFHMPPIRRFPTILWVRIKKSIEQYIMEKEANDTKIIQWHHRKFIDVTLDYYVKSASRKENEAMYQNIIDYYNDTWQNRAKPFEMNDYLKNKYKDVVDRVAERYLTPQPIQYVGTDGKTRFNKRKLTELPNCLAKINNQYGLEKACELVFFNYEFMHSKFTCESLSEVIDDLKRVLNESDMWEDERKSLLSSFKQLKLYQKTLDLCGSLIEDYPSSLSFQLSSRWLNYYGIFNYVTKFIDECDKLGPKICSLISPYFQQNSPGSYLISSIHKHYEPVFKCVTLNKFFITYSPNRINVYKSKDGDSLQYLFNLKLPDRNKIKEWVNNQKYKFYKTFDSNSQNYVTGEQQEISGVDLSELVDFKVLSENVICNKLIEDNIEQLSNPDLFPAWFLIVNKHYVYIITPNNEIKFAYDVTSFGKSKLPFLIVLKNEK